MKLAHNQKGNEATQMTCLVFNWSFYLLRTQRLSSPFLVSPPQHPPPHPHSIQPKADLLGDETVDNLLSYLSGEQNCGVIVLCIPVTGAVVLFLPAAEIPKGESGVGGNFRSLLLLIYDQDLHHHQAN